MFSRAYSQTGVTLVELLVSIAILAVLMTVAVPSFQTFIVSNQVGAFSDHLYASLLLTRSEAIKRNGHAVICKSSDGATCTGNWNNGWIVFADSNKDGSPSGETIIQKMGAQSGNYTLTSLPDSVSYDSQGTATSGASYFAICPSSGTCKYVCVPQYGTPKISSSSSCS